MNDNITVTYVPRVADDGVRLPGHWEIEGVAPYTFRNGEPQKFTATIPECYCDRPGCGCRKNLYAPANRRHAREHCHNWHQPKVDDFVAAVVRSYLGGR